MKNAVKSHQLVILNNIFPPSVLVQDLIEVDCFVSSPRASILRCLFAYTNYFIKKENCLFCLHVSFDGMWLVRYP